MSIVLLYLKFYYCCEIILGSNLKNNFSGPLAHFLNSFKTRSESNAGADKKTPSYFVERHIIVSKSRIIQRFWV